MKRIYIINGSTVVTSLIITRLSTKRRLAVRLKPWSYEAVVSEKQSDVVLKQ